MALPIANAGAAPPDYAFSSLPIASIALSGSGTPGTGGTSITGYAWVMIDSPPGSTAALSATNVANPNLLTVNTDGTVFLFLKVQDNLGNWSEQDPTKAPDSAFIAISVENELLEIVKPAIGQRNWAERIWAFVDATESFKNDFDLHTIESHVGTVATGAQLDTLVGGVLSNADSLHTHEDLAIVNAGTLNTNEIRGVSDPAVGFDLLAGEIDVLGDFNVSSGDLSVDTINGVTDPTSGIDIGTGEVGIRGDLLADVIKPVANDSFVEIEGTGTSVYDLVTDSLSVGTINLRPITYPLFYYSNYIDWQPGGTLLETAVTFDIPALATAAQGGKLCIEVITQYAANTNNKRLQIEITDGTATEVLINQTAATTGTRTVWTCELLPFIGGNQAVNAFVFPNGSPPQWIGGAPPADIALDRSQVWQVTVSGRAETTATDLTIMYVASWIEPSVIPSP